MNIIEIKNLSVGYERKSVIKNLNVNIEEGDFITIVGPNGSGKTTLVKSILGLIQPIKGSIKLNNIKRTFIGYMPQETKVDKNFPASVYEIVLSGTLNRSNSFLYNSEQKKIANEVMKLLKIDNLKNKNFCDLSGGQRQKVLLARGVAASSKLLILDEPSNNLDFKSNKEFLDIINKLNVDKKITVLMITHDLDHVNLIGNKVLALNGGDYFYGNNEEYMEMVSSE